MFLITFLFTFLFKRRVLISLALIIDIIIDYIIGDLRRVNVGGTQRNIVTYLDFVTLFTHCSRFV